MQFQLQRPITQANCGQASTRMLKGKPRPHCDFLGALIAPVGHT